MRLTGEKANEIFGTRFLPIISNDDPMAGKILAYAHRGKVWEGEDIHYSSDGTIARMQSGQFGVLHKYEEDDGRAQLWVPGM